MSESNDKLEHSLKQLNRDLDEIERALREHESRSAEVEGIDKPERSTAHLFKISFISAIAGSLAMVVILSFI